MKKESAYKKQLKNYVHELKMTLKSLMEDVRHNKASALISTSRANNIKKQIAITEKEIKVAD